MHIEQALVLHNQEKNPGCGIFLLRLHAPVIAQAAKAGQFVQLQVNEGYDPLLRRPFSFHSIDKDNGTFEILYQVVGKGTKLLSHIKPDSRISVLGPLGNGFTVDPDLKEAIIIGGGMGIAPLFELTNDLQENNVEYEFFYGARNKAVLDALEILDLFDENFLATDDGSFGYNGFVTTLFENHLQNNEKPTIFACGPTPMLRAVQKLAKRHKLSGQISLEARMACGFGVCLGCAVKKAKDDGYYKVCKDGPVFAIDEVTLDE